MKLTGKLKVNVKKAENKEQAKKPIAKAGIILSDDELKEKNEQTETKENAAMELTDAELAQVSGGAGFYPDEEVVHT